MLAGGDGRRVTGARPKSPRGGGEQKLAAKTENKRRQYSSGTVRREHRNSCARSRPEATLTGCWTRRNEGGRKPLCDEDLHGAHSGTGWRVLRAREPGGNKRDRFAEKVLVLLNFGIRMVSWSGCSQQGLKVGELQGGHCFVFWSVVISGKPFEATISCAKWINDSYLQNVELQCPSEGGWGMPADLRQAAAHSLGPRDEVEAEMDVSGRIVKAASSWTVNQLFLARQPRKERELAQAACRIRLRAQRQMMRMFDWRRSHRPHRLLFGCKLLSAFVIVAVAVAAAECLSKSYTTLSPVSCGWLLSSSPAVALFHAPLAPSIPSPLSCFFVGNQPHPSWPFSLRMSYQSPKVEEDGLNWASFDRIRVRERGIPVAVRCVALWALLFPMVGLRYAIDRASIPHGPSVMVLERFSAEWESSALPGGCRLTLGRCHLQDVIVVVLAESMILPAGNKVDREDIRQHSPTVVIMYASVERLTSVQRVFDSAPRGRFGECSVSRRRFSSFLPISISKAGSASSHSPLTKCAPRRF
ncbi:hypothetical protein CCUS01_11487 [Colletotrichum cuscutae]|uniref:Uncharacterized protein n=1 Tax=Colletotrichum cuscutae TaxID=1209917 RepID=A0AAI9TZ07_9PEZI|nr:hypothetical protein CCUS01_11487 [Colletotrichum cuscutae]